MASKKRIGEFDLLRVVAAASVVFLHAAATAVAGLGAAPGWNALFLLHSYAGFAVPAFLFMAGALSWARPLERGVRPYLAFMRRRLTTILPAYVAWSAIYWFLANRGLGFVPPTAEANTLRGFLVGLLTGDNWRHLYFVPLIVIVYALTPIAVRFVRRSPSAFFLGLLVFAVLWHSLAASAGGWMAGDVGRFVSLMPAAAAGAWYAVRRDCAGAPAWWGVRGWAALLVAGLAVQSVFVTGSLGSVPTPVATLATTLWPISITLGLAGACAFAGARLPRVARWGMVLAPLTYGVYLAHPAFLILLYRLTRIAHTPGVWSSPRLLVFKWGYALLAGFATAAVTAAVAHRLRRTTG